MISLDWLVILRPTPTGMKAGKPMLHAAAFWRPRKLQSWTVAIASGNEATTTWWTTTQDSGRYAVAAETAE